MEVIRDIYYWNVEDEIKAGKIIRAVDKLRNDNFLVNNVSAQDFFEIMEKCKNDPCRFAFWVKQEVEENVTTE